MSFIGDIERLLAQLWPFRVPIAIGLLVVLVIALFTAYRRGWHRVAARHPRSTLTAVVIALVVGLPVAWVLGSPLFIRTELTEEPPAVAAGSEARVLLEGELVGADEFHFGMGTVRLVETSPGSYSLAFDDISVQNGPDLFVYLSPDPDGWTEEAVLLGGLKATDGSFSYDVPVGVDPATVGSAVIWCRAFSVLFATASLAPPAA
jgi:hypothetical protein